jgi:hypothetical protein
MDPKSQLSPTSRSTSNCAPLSLGAQTISPTVNAATRNLGLWRSAYPNASTDGNLDDPCALSHASQTRANLLNTYGLANRQSGTTSPKLSHSTLTSTRLVQTRYKEISANTPQGLMNIFNQYQHCRVL